MGEILWHPILFKGRLVRKILEGEKTQTRRVLKIPTEWRLAKKPDSYGFADFAFLDMADPVGTYPTLRKCPYGQPGDRLWVRETAWYDKEAMLPMGMRCFFESGHVKMQRGGHYGLTPGGDSIGESGHAAELMDLNDSLRKRPSIHMPRWASRITLEVVEVRVERLQDMTEADAVAEGVDMEWYADNPEPGSWPCPQCKGTGVYETAYPPDYGVREVDCDKCDTAVKMFGHLWNSINKKRGWSWEGNPWVWVVTFKGLNGSHA